MFKPDNSPPNRENPFNREIHVDERHYNTSLIEQAESVVILPRSPMLSPIAQDTGGFMDAIAIPDSDFGLSPENRRETVSAGMGLSREEELSLAIDSCKEMIIQSDPHSEGRRKLVQKLVQLRLQLQDLKENQKEGVEEVADVQAKWRRVCGHQFVLQERTGGKPYCERCRGMVWRLIQPWYRCKVCGYRSHGKCLDLIRRICAGVQAKRSPGYMLKINPEQGLAAQKYRCAECRAKIAFNKGTELEPRLCDYSGLYFCSGCHWNDAMVIPSRVIHNWDFEPQLVSRSSKQLLQILEPKPLLKVEELNPALFNYVEELRLIRKMRADILLMKCYFVCCREARKQRILWNLKKHQHFVEGAEIYSLQDLIQLQNGKLEVELRNIIDIFGQHIKKDCLTCNGNGFICELCDDKEIIFPFDDYISICRQCFAVFHRRCFDKEKTCSRCHRREVRKTSLLVMGERESPDSSPERPLTHPTPTHPTPTTLFTSSTNTAKHIPQRIKVPPPVAEETPLVVTQVLHEKESSSPQPIMTSTKQIQDNIQPTTSTKRGGDGNNLDDVIRKTESLNPFETEEKDYDRDLNPFEGSSPEKSNNSNDSYDKSLNPFS